jgi:hypothetical protein
MSLYPGNPEPEWGPKKATKRYSTQQPTPQNANSNLQDFVLPGGMGLPEQDCHGHTKWEDVPDTATEGSRVGHVERTVEWMDRFRGIDRVLKRQ